MPDVEADGMVVAEFLSRATLQAVEAVFVSAERMEPSCPADLVVSLEHQEAVTSVENGQGLIRYAHRATFTHERPEPHNGRTPTTEEASPGTVGRVEVHHVVVFSVEDVQHSDAAALAAFAEADGYFMAYPYIRESLQRLAASVSLPPVTLPMLQRTPRS